ncbi:unnamed protein product [Acanthoscelides obtectus]|uniref:C2H2-type domain-containing protein n=1 Tax=Acanthoscelides obtectus TaxID=200917 RepID=A0A9P0K2N1_ACAOB|nr:unnamed protein product [Acanthoscelides obtectus]CAK1669723.1 Longitudinals lacking protein, isoforms A/B/D/L [Acanthoscelides obtectus]
MKSWKKGESEADRSEHRSSSRNWIIYDCTTCGKPYKHYPSLWRHKKYECQKEPAFRCFFCNYKAKQKVNLNLHILNRHKDKFINSTETVAANYCLKFETSKHTP